MMKIKKGFAVVLAVFLLISIFSGGISLTANALQNSRAGWVQNSDKTWSYYETGKAVTGWKLINGAYYYFNSKGSMQTGWVKSSSAWYYLGNNGKMQTGWVKSGSAWYYLGSNGKMQTGWVKSGSGWYYLGSNGKMQTGWQKISNKWYYFGSNGKMQTGWLKNGGKWYYLRANGSMVTGSCTIDGKTYTFGADGALKGSSSSSFSTECKEAYRKLIMEKESTIGTVKYLLYDINADGLPELFESFAVMSAFGTVIYTYYGGAVKELGTYTTTAVDPTGTYPGLFTVVYIRSTGRGKISYNTLKNGNLITEDVYEMENGEFSKVVTSDRKLYQISRNRKVLENEYTWYTISDTKEWNAFLQAYGY